MQNLFVNHTEASRWAVLSLSFVVGIACASSQSLAVGVGKEKPVVRVASAADATVVRMGFAESINIRVPEYRILSGQYRVGSDGSVALPGIGRLKVGQLTTAEFESRLRDAIYRVSNREANVAVEIATYRPFYVSGAVARAGSFPWRPGMSVVHAQALAGGVNRGPLPGQAIVVNAQGPGGRQIQVSRAALDLATVLATIERLKTERKGGSVYLPPKRLSKLVGNKELARLVTRQETLLSSRRAAYEARISALQNTKALTANEKHSLEMQRVRINEQLVNRKGFRERVKRLTAQGYSRADRVFEEQVRIAALEERLTTTTLGISRLVMAESAAQQELEVFVRGRAAEIDLELLDLEQRVAQLELQLGAALGPAGTQDSATDEERTADNNEPGEGAAGGANPALAEIETKYEIIRVLGGKNVVLQADRTTSLQPGDVLIVL